MRMRRARSTVTAAAGVLLGVVVIGPSACAVASPEVDRTSASPGAAAASEPATHGGSNRGTGPTGGTGRATAAPPRRAPAEAPAPPAPGSGAYASYPKTTARQCSVLIAGVRPDTNLVGFRYEKGRVDAEVAGKIGWVPRTMTTVTDLKAAQTMFWAIREDGMLYRISVIADDGGVRVTAKRAATGWGEVRVLAAGSPTGDTGVTYLYGLTVNGGLKRYVTSADGERLLSSQVIATTGWSDIRTLSFDRVQLTGPGTRPREADVMLAVTRRGYLSEFAFPRTHPLLWTRTNLRTSTWNVFATVTSGFCDSERPSRPIVAVKPDGAAFLYVDQNGNDRWAGDIGRGTKVATWAGAKLFNQ